MRDLQGKKVVVIGGTSGIGLATAMEASELGAEVWAVGRSVENIEKAKSIASESIQFSQLDVHNAEDFDRLFLETGKFDHLVSAATGANRTMKPFMEQTAQQFSEAFNKFWGYTNVVRQGVPHMNQEGSITLVSGVPARKCNPGMSSVSCVGNAVEGLGRALALELAPIRVNVVAPGVISTGMFDWMGEKKNEILEGMTKQIPLGRAGQPWEVANAILFFMTTTYATGTCVDVDGGQLLP
jgi:NAD(P)-dependent dehydrogenase (short-subunit alcohol dehydrogenase family)